MGRKTKEETDLDIQTHDWHTNIRKGKYYTVQEKVIHIILQRQRKNEVRQGGTTYRCLQLTGHVAQVCPGAGGEGPDGAHLQSCEVGPQIRPGVPT